MVTADAPNLRAGVLGALDLLSSSERQLEYERRVPHVSIPTELECMWFDDVYIPDSEAFKRSFSEEELAAMAAFNTYYEERRKLLPQDIGVMTFWLKNEVWQEIMGKAEEALSILRV
jgi:hypothetical protein